MALNTNPTNFCDGQIALQSSGAGVTVTAQYSNGDFAISGLKSTLREHTAYEARGVLTSVRYTTRVYPTISFTCQMTGLTNATAFVADAVRKQGAFVAATSALGANADVWACDLVWTVEGTTYGGAADIVMTATNVVCTLDVSEGDPNSLSISGTVYGTITTTG